MNYPDIHIPGYTIHGQIGHGGMASVYLATQESLNRKVAIKVLRNSAEDGVNERFIKEAHFIASLANPHIITIHDISTLANGDYYIAMEYVGDGDLADNRHHFREPAAILQLIRQIAQGLAVVHDRGIIHRDVKPANILFREDGTAVLTDFGIAKDVDNNSDLTQAGSSLGSPAYSSPEQAQGQPLDITTDIYSLGVILLELLLGYNPYRGDSHTSTAINHIQRPIPALPDEFAYLQPLLDPMLAKQPADRFQSCHELADTIATMADAPAGVRTTTARAPALVPPRWLKGKMVPLAGAGAGLVAIACVIMALTYESETDRRIRELLQRAEQGLAEGRYISPEQDNARYYYRQVLLLDDNNPAAARGLRAVTKKRIEALVILGAEALEHDRLHRPKDDNAIHYYREALTLDPDNPQATAGIGQVTAEYIRRARAGLLEDDLERADYNVKWGLRISPDNRDLLALRSELDEKMPAAKKFIRDVFGKLREAVDSEEG
ncbi:serine/threonine-protein kinase [Microbulbifer sediminum]|uniref:serine/threonine-protein kinase n=1 Tax=Microbulbifer sediminum TaxID=2904250 RepID=UPI001F018D98|nr:serine/threonine-protein kinase [Microbulbifer sediminum]